MAVQQFDELNTLRSHAETWFSKMAVPEEAKKRRVDLTMDYTLIMLMLFDMITSGKSSKPKETVFLRERLKAVADKYVGTKDTAYINDWSREEAIRIVDETHKQIEEAEKPTEPAAEILDEEAPETTEEKDVIHFDEYDVDIPKAEYPTSDFRGMLIAVECATSVSNYDDFYQAVEKNGAARKVWISEADGRVRATHDEAHGQERPITKLFNVGDSELMFPGDITHGADMKEIYNCRCHVVYLKETELWVENTSQNGIIKAKYSLPDEYFPRSVGAKFKNMNIMDLATGEMYHLAEGTHLQNKEVFAGKGGPKPFERAEDYANKYGGKPEDWMHVKGFGYVETSDGIFKAEIHWSECEGIGKIDPFIKEWLDEEG